VENFDEWNEVKKQVNLKSRSTPKEGEIWFVHLGYNIGFETYGKNNLYTRQVLVVKSFGDNGCWIIPLTSKYKKHYFIHKIKEESFGNILQLKFIDNKRCVRKIDDCSNVVLKEIKDKIKNILI